MPVQLANCDIEMLKETGFSGDNTHFMSCSSWAWLIDCLSCTEVVPLEFLI